MNTRLNTAWFAATLLLTQCGLMAQPAPPNSQRIGFHAVRRGPNGALLPWAAADPGAGYDKTLNLLWFYWAHVPPYWDSQPTRISHGVSVPGSQLGAIDIPIYMLFRTLETLGIGGDQFAMLLSSWDLYYRYTGNPAVKQNMIYLAETYLAHSLSPDTAAWPHLPYPCNGGPTLVYDGDLMLGDDVTQPDKAGSFAAELVTLYEMTGNEDFLRHATAIADVLASHTKPGDADHSPLPFKVNAVTGEVRSAYTTNWTGTLRLFQELDRIHKGKESYQQAFQTILAWMKQYPMVNNRWGPFFEDIPGWSDTQINAGTFAWYLMENKSWDANWKQDVRHIQDWVIRSLGNSSLLSSLGVLVINEQTAYPIPGQSHTSRHASVELRYAAETGDLHNKEMAIRQLNWATYFVDDDGKSRYPDPRTYEIWWTDGYGDFVRHYLRSMAAFPELAPAGQAHLLSSTSAVRDIKYGARRIDYTLFDSDATAILRLASKPASVDVDGKTLPAGGSPDDAGWSWKPLASGGVLRIHQRGGHSVSVRLASGA